MSAFPYRSQAGFLGAAKAASDHQELTSLAAAQIVWTWLSGRVRAMRA